MNRNELQACKDGYIYIHDQSARLDTMNCCLFDVASVPVSYTHLDVYKRQGLSCISFSEKTDMYPLGSGRLIHSHRYPPYKNTDCAYKSDFLCI